MSDPNDDESEINTFGVWFSDHVKAENLYRSFEAYGHAMATASTFEMLMSLMIMKAMVLRLDKRAGQPINPSDHDGLRQALLRSTYDSLQRRLSRCYTLSFEVRTGLADGKEMRDHLAHNFWHSHASSILCDDGTDIFATHCMTIVHHFRLLITSLLNETGVTATDYIEMLKNDPARESNLAGWQALLQEEGLA